MPIDWTELHGVTARKIASALLRDGFVLRSQRGSHQRFRHSDGRKVTVAFHHLSDTFTRKTFRAMIQDQAKWGEDDLKGLGLVK